MSAVAGVEPVVMASQTLESGPFIAQRWTSERCLSSRPKSKINRQDEFDPSVQRCLEALSFSYRITAMESGAG